MHRQLISGLEYIPDIFDIGSEVYYQDSVILLIICTTFVHLEPLESPWIKDSLDPVSESNPTYHRSKPSQYRQQFPLIFPTQYLPLLAEFVAFEVNQPIQKSRIRLEAHRSFQQLGGI